MKFLQYGFALFICVLFFSASTHQAFASGACSSNGVGTSWNTAADWTGTCSGVGGLPAAGDNVTISSGHPITLDVATPALGTLNINDTFTTSGSNFAVTASSITITGGTFHANGSTVTLTGTSGTLFNLVSGTFTSDTSTFVLSGNGSATVSNMDANFNNLTSSGTGTKSLGSNLEVNGVLSITAGTFDTTTSNYNLTLLGTVSIGASGTLTANGSTITIYGVSSPIFANSGTFNAGTSTINLAGNGSATFNSSDMTLCNLTSSGTGTKTQGGALSLTSSSSCNFSVTNGTWDPATNEIGGLVGSQMSVTNATVLVPFLATFSGTYGFTTSNVSLGAGSTTVFSASGSQTIQSNLTYGNLTISGSGTKSLSGATSATNAVTVSSGTLATSGQTLTAQSIAISGGTVAFGSSTINLTGTSGTLFTHGGGIILPGTSTINLTGNGSAAVNTAAAISVCNLVSNGSGTKTLGGAVSIASGCGLSVTNGIFDAGSSLITGSGSTLSVSNAVINIGASTFGGNYTGFSTPTLGTGSTVNYDASGTQTVDNTLSYYNLTITGGAREVDFLTSAPTTVSNAFTANGSAGNILNLFSSSPGTAWALLSTGTTSVSYVNVRDGGCGAGAVFATSANFTDGGNNGSCWVVPVVVATATPIVNHGTAAVMVIVPSALGSGALDFILNNGSSTVNNSAVTLNLNADPKTVSGYAVSLDPNFVNGGIQPYVAGVPATFQLPDAVGTYTVYVEYFSPTGARSAVILHTVSYGNGGATPAATSQNVGKGTFTRTLTHGSSGADVTLLQKLLISDGELVMPIGADFGYFGSATKTALEAFQVKYGIVSAGGPGYGMFGPKTRAKANGMAGV